MGVALRRIEGSNTQHPDGNACMCYARRKCVHAGEDECRKLVVHCYTVFFLGRGSSSLSCLVEREREGYGNTSQ